MSNNRRRTDSTARLVRNAQLRAPREAELLDSLPFYLARLYHGFVALVGRLRGDEPADVPSFRPGAASVYFTVLANEGCTVSEVAAWLRIPKPTVTGLLDGLERDRVVERFDCSQDGRAVRLRVTAAGRSLEQGFRKRHAAAVAELEAGLGAAERRELHRLLRHVLGNLDGLRERGQPRARRSVKRKNSVTP